MPVSSKRSQHNSIPFEMMVPIFCIVMNNCHLDLDVPSLHSLSWTPAMAPFLPV